MLVLVELWIVYLRDFSFHWAIQETKAEVLK
jgi:hypothetical protein